MGTRVRIGAVVAVACLAVAFAPTGAGAAPPAGPARQAIEWQPCAPDQPDQPGQCGTIQVPVDWAHPHGATFPLAIGRLPATDPAHRIGVLMADPGGPGGSGIDSFILDQAFGADSPLRQRFDIVSWDPRGVERSHPVVCDAALLAQFPTGLPDTPRQYADLLAYNRKLGADCRAHTGPLFDHVDTVSTVRDMDAIRAALGERTISYYGVSYGTQIGQQYAELFGDRLRALALDSNMDHSITSAYDYLRTATHDFEGSVDEFAAWCERTAGCALYGHDVLAVWDSLREQARAGTLTDPATGEPVTLPALSDQEFGAMYAPTRWPALATWLAGLARLGGAAAAPAATRVAPAEDLGENAYQAIWCEDWHWDVHSFGQLQAYRRDLAARYPHTQMTSFWGDVAACLGWPARVNNPQHRLSVRHAPTVLFSASRDDVGTPRPWTEAAARQVPHSVLLRYAGVGHGDYFRTPCARAAINTYLLDLTTPPPGTTCPAVWPDATATAAVATPAPALRHTSADQVG